MLHATDPRYQRCARVGQTVQVCRTEAQCRQQFGCTDPDCPLANAFGMKAFDQRMKAFATVFDLWPLGEAEQRDFP